MIALDTNVLVRLLTRDDPKQAERARSLFEEHAAEDGALFISDVVLAELAWTLERAYGRDRADISKALGSLADNATLRFESLDTIRVALRLFASGPAGFPDCLIAATAAASGCESLRTFDKSMAGLPGVHLL